MEGLQENIKTLKERINALELALANPKVTIDKSHSIYVLERAKLLLDELEFKFYEFIDSTEYITQKVNEEIKNLE
mgnify:CR=1 FL=1